jgi:cation-transporting ATPase 13A1
VIQQLLTEVPAHYEITYKQHMSEGKRVIALAYRQLPADMQASTLRGLTRADFEKNLTLAGLVTFDCELKLDSMSVMRDLHRSSHKTCMITGDGVLTAADVARQLQMVTRPATKTLVLSTRPGDAELVWMSLEQAEPLEREVLPFNLSAVSGLATEADLCVTGASLEQLIAARGPGNAVHRLSKLCPHVRVFARVSPEQKELILSAFGAAGCVTLMCGDGTNDVGALKQVFIRELSRSCVCRDRNVHLILSSSYLGARRSVHCE